MNGPRIVVGDNFLVPEFTRDVDGHVVDLGGPMWRLNSPDSTHTTLNWRRLEDADENAVAALRIHVVRLIETSSSRHVFNTFHTIAKFLSDLQDVKEAPAKSVTLASLMWVLERYRAKRVGYRFHHIRQWYFASADRMLEGFDDEVVYALRPDLADGEARAVNPHGPDLGEPL